MSCVFCKIVRGESPAEVLYEDRSALAILDINPIHFGHALILPKSHRETFLDVPDEELLSLASATKLVSAAIVRALSPAGFNIFSNNGRAAGQSVFHFHFHVTPRYEHDDIRFVLQLKSYSDREMSEYAARIRQSFNNHSVNNP